MDATGTYVKETGRTSGLHVGRYPPQPVSVLGPILTLSPSFLLAQAIFEPNLFLYKYSNILKPSHSSYLSAYEDGTDSVLKCWHINSDARELPKRKHTTTYKVFSNILYTTLLPHVEH